MMILLIGDVQGCAATLQRLLDQSGFSASRDRLVLLGDLVNRGPDSLGVLQMVARLGGAARCLLGNHDLHLLAVAHGARRLSRKDTFEPILQAPQAAQWLDWLRQQPLALMESGWLCVHAGVVPQWDCAQTLALAAEVQQVLRGAALDEFLHQMYADEPEQWDESLSGVARTRFVVNALTRIRFCNAQGRLDFKTKEGRDAAPAGYQPWFEVTGRKTAGQPIAFGHWSTLGLLNQPTLLGLDTGCVWGGRLSAMRVDEGRRELIQVECSAGRRIP